jgi:hypothetical protein
MTQPATRKEILDYHIAERDRLREQLTRWDEPMVFGYVSPEDKVKGKATITEKIAFHDRILALLVEREAPAS